MNPNAASLNATGNSSLYVNASLNATKNSSLHAINGNASFNATGNASLRSSSSGYESLIQESSGNNKPQLSLDPSSSSRHSLLSGHRHNPQQRQQYASTTPSSRQQYATTTPASRQHPKLQDDELLKPIVPPFHLPPGFESPADDIFSRPFSSSTSSFQPFSSSSSQPFSSSSSSTSFSPSDFPSSSRAGFVTSGTGFDCGVVGSRVLSGTATSPMPPGRTSRPVAKLFSSHQSQAKKRPSPSSSSSSAVSKDGAGSQECRNFGAGTPSPHSSGGASSVSALLRIPQSGQVKSGSGQNSSLLMSSGNF